MTVNVPARAVPRGMDVDEFMGWLEIRPKEERWHLVEGTAIMMNPLTIRHQQISLNLRDFLLQAIRDRGLDLLVLHEVGVRVPGVNDFQPRPDVAVVPRVPDDALYAERFLLVAEVLSPTNTKREIAQKLARYKEHPENLYCLVLDSKRVWGEIHARSRNWKPVELKRTDDVMELPEFGLRCPPSDLYRDTTLFPQQTHGRR